MNRTVGFSAKSGNERMTLCIVGVAEYHVAPQCLKSFQKEGDSFSGMIIALPARSGTRNEASRPWTWKSGMISTVRSSTERP